MFMVIVAMPGLYHYQPNHRARSRNPSLEPTPSLGGAARRSRPESSISVSSRRAPRRAKTAARFRRRGGEGGRARGVPRDGGFESPLPAVDLRQGLALHPGLAGEVEEGVSVGDEGLGPPALGGGQEEKRGREVAQQAAGEA